MNLNSEDKIESEIHPFISFQARNIFQAIDKGSTTMMIYCDIFGSNTFLGKKREKGKKKRVKNAGDANKLLAPDKELYQG